MGITNGKWKVYQDPIMAAGAKNRKALKEFASLHWNDVAHFCDEKANSVTVDQVSDPNYDPWIVIHATKTKHDNEQVKLVARYVFLYNPSSGTVFFKKSRTDEIFRKIRQDRKVYKRVIEKIEEAEVRVYKPHKGNSSLGTGFFYAPYIPKYKTPPTINPSNFKMRKGLRNKIKPIKNSYYTKKTII